MCPGFLWSQLRTGDLAPVLQKFKNLVDVVGLGHTCFSLFLVISDALVTQGCPNFCHLWATLEGEELSWATHYIHCDM